MESGIFDENGAYIFALVGVRYDNRQKGIDFYNDMRDERERGCRSDYFMVRREYNNMYDPRACAVYLCGELYEKVGYVRAKETTPFVQYFRTHPSKQKRGVRVEPLEEPMPRDGCILMRATSIGGAAAFEKAVADEQRKKEREMKKAAVAREKAAAEKDAS